MNRRLQRLAETIVAAWPRLRPYLARAVRWLRPRWRRAINLQTPRQRHARLFLLAWSGLLVLATAVALLLR